ncbi:MAG: hypothetical protein IT442_07525 [Phycisphaeraceae bacterium]|nr:hypothetical protein [Phycisphaeraceae bacterium]
MTDEQWMRELLEQATPPNLTPSEHQQRLKALLLLAESALPADHRRIRRFSPRLRTAATVLLALSLVASGWAAEQGYQAIKRLQWFYSSERKTYKLDPFTTPDGKTHNGDVTISGGGMRDWPTDGQSRSDADMVPAPQQAPGRQTSALADPPAPPPQNIAEEQAMDQAIDQGHFKLEKTVNGPVGGTAYVYRVTLPDGSTKVIGSGTYYDPAERGTMLERTLQFTKRVHEAFSAGRFRLINAEPIVTHVCRDLQSGKEWSVQRFEDAQHQQFAMFYPMPLDGRTVAGWRTSWQEHLDAIASGRRELLDCQTIPLLYIYEVVLDDDTVVRQATCELYKHKPDLSAFPNVERN